jgi:anti-sigma-K factor RskA
LVRLALQELLESAAAVVVLAVPFSPQLETHLMFICLAAAEQAQAAVAREPFWTNQLGLLVLAETQAQLQALAVAAAAVRLF